MRYQYIGPVYHFGRVVIKKFDVVTEAVSEGKALANISFRAKTSLGYPSNWKIEVDKKYLKEIKTVNEKEIQLTFDMIGG